MFTGRRVSVSVFAGIFGMALLASAPVAGQPSQPAGKGGETRVALVIGNGEYPNVPLKNPPNDVRDLAKALTGLGFAVNLLVDADYPAMNRAIRDFGNAIKRPDAIALFYYSGHGVQYRGANYLIPARADIQSPDEFRYSAVNVDQVYAKMEAAGAKTNIVILDACRNNPFPGTERALERGLTVVGDIQPPQALIVYATAPGKTAQDGDGRNGVFTTALLKHLAAPGLDVELMLRLVREDVITATKGLQVPWHNSSLTGAGFSFTGGGRLSVSTEPSGAEIYVGGEKRGLSPLTLADLPRFSEIEIQARAEGLSATRKLVLRDAAEQRLELRLEFDPQAISARTPARIDPSARATISLTSEPSGAEILIDEDKVVVTPAVLDLPPGTHSIHPTESLTSDGLYVVEQSKQWLNVAPGAVMTIPLKLEIGRASLSTRLAPPGFEVFINGKSAGRTPLGGVSIEAGRIEARFEKAGEKNRNFASVVNPGEEALLEWGWNKDSAVRLERRAIAFEAKADSWKGIEALAKEESHRYGLLGGEDYEVTGVYLCRDDRYLYWRFDFKSANPFEKRPKGLKKALTCELELNPGTGSNLKLGFSFSVKENRTNSYIGLWQESTRKWTGLANDAIAQKLSSTMLVARVPLAKLGDRVRGPVSLVARLVHETDSGWESGFMYTLPRFVIIDD